MSQVKQEDESDSNLSLGEDLASDFEIDEGTTEDEVVTEKSKKPSPKKSVSKPKNTNTETRNTKTDITVIAMELAIAYHKGEKVSRQQHPRILN